MDHLTQIIVALARKSVRFIVCGGVAAVLQGVERMTLDLDLAVDRKPDNMERFLEVMRDLAMEPRVPIPPEVLLDPEKVRVMREEKGALVFTFLDQRNPYKQVDFFLMEEMNYESLIAHTDSLDIQNFPIRTLSRKKLIEIKEAIVPPRDKDLWDINELKRLENER